LFLRRKPTTILIGPQLPNMPATKAYPNLTAPAYESTQPKPTTQEPQPTVAKASVTQENLIQAAMTTQIPAIYETWQSQTPLAQDAQNQQQLKPATTEPTQTITTHLSKISETGKKVKDLEAALMVERENLTKEVNDLNKMLEEQERAVKNYFDSIRQALAAISASPSEANDNQKIPPKESINNQNTSPSK
jgi:hypothetical protein